MFLLVNSECDVEIEEEEDEEELYELASGPNGVTSDVSSEAEGGQGDEQSEMSDSNEKDAASSCLETTLHPLRAIIEDIRFVHCLHLNIMALFWQMWLIQRKAHLCFPLLSNRKTEFGIGVEMTPESQKLIQTHQNRLGRSLERLSTELYSKDTHFVLELIQVLSVIFTPCHTPLSAALYFLNLILIVSSILNTP